MSPVVAAKVATVVLLLLQVPPAGVLVSVRLLPMQTVNVPLMVAGNGWTVRTAVV